MRVLLLNGSSRQIPTQPSGPEKIVAGPDFPDAQTLDGEWLSLRTPAGTYDVASVLTKIPYDQQPDMLVSFLGQEWRNHPRNLTAFPGEKLLVVVDSRDLTAWLSGSAKPECYDRIVFLSETSRCEFLASAVSQRLPGPTGLSVIHNEAALARELAGLDFNFASS